MKWGFLDDDSGYFYCIIYKNGIAWNPSMAIRTEEDVTERPLKIYDRLMEAMANA